MNRKLFLFSLVASAATDIRSADEQARKV